MALLRLPAIETTYLALTALNDLIEQLTENVCAACGYPTLNLDEKEALIKACRSAAQSASQILDRTGMGPHSTLEIKQSDGDLNLAAMSTEERAEFAQVLAQFKHLKQRVKSRIAGGNTPSQVM